MRRAAALIPASLVLALAATAQGAEHKPYRLTRPKHQHCRVNYVRKVEHHKVHGRKVKQVWCVYVAPKPKPATGVLPSIASQAPAPARTVHLHAHLDPSFMQSPMDALAVTYAYSASATEESPDLAKQAAPSLPSGVLELYSDGLLACSMNVGGTVSGGECPVSYSEYGAHTVIVTYASTSANASETVVEQIEAFPAVPPIVTHVALSVTQTGCAEDVTERWTESTTEGNREASITEHRCSYTVEASSNVAEQQLTLLIGRRGAGARPLALPIANGGSCALTAATWTEVAVDRYHPTAAPTVSGCGGQSTYEVGTPEADETWSIVAEGNGGPSWAASESEPQTLDS